MRIYENQDCINLVFQELERDPNFLDLRDTEIIEYLKKIDEKSSFERYYIDGNLAGFLSYYCNDYITREAFLGLMVVDEKYRGMKVAQNLMNRGKAIAQEKGFIKCKFQVKLENTHAIRIYKKLGYEENYRDDKSIFMSIAI